MSTLTKLIVILLIIFISWLILTSVFPGFQPDYTGAIMQGNLNTCHLPILENAWACQ